MGASCQSLTSQLIKVSGDFLKKYQDFRTKAAQVYVSTIIPGKGDTQKALNGLIEDAFSLQNDLLNAYGKLTGEGSGKIGARDLLIPTKKVTGSLIATERTFIIAPSPFDKVIVTIKKTDGKAGADICACAKHGTGEYFDKKERAIDKGKETIGRDVTMVLENMVDKITTLHLVHTGFPTDKFEYTVSVEGEFSASAMQSLMKKAASVH